MKHSIVLHFLQSRGLNPFEIRASLKREDTGEDIEVGLNPFEIRASLKRSKNWKAWDSSRLNPFEIRASLKHTRCVHADGLFAS